MMNKLLLLVVCRPRRVNVFEWLIINLWWVGVRFDFGQFYIQNFLYIKYKSVNFN